MDCFLHESTVWLQDQVQSHHVSYRTSNFQIIWLIIFIIILALAEYSLPGRNGPFGEAFGPVRPLPIPVCMTPQSISSASPSPAKKVKIEAADSSN